MNIIGNIYVGKRYALFTNNRPVKSTRGSVVFFEDGSMADIDGGAMFDYFNGTDKHFTLVELKNGLNTLKFGTLNPNPQTKAWAVNSLQIDYPGKVDILPAADGLITVEENAYCHASFEGNQVIVSIANYMEISIVFGNSNNVFFKNDKDSENNYPPLRIWAPVNTKLTGSLEALTFD